MACTGRYAEAFDWMILACVGDTDLIVSTDTGAAASRLYVEDALATFVDGFDHDDIERGMPIRNGTTGVTGSITAITSPTRLETSIPFSLGDRYEIIIVDPRLIPRYEMYLDMAAGYIHNARAAAGACDCALSSAAVAYLRTLNVQIGLVYHNCPCGNAHISDNRLSAMMRQVHMELEAIRTGQYEVCAGETGKDFAVLEIANVGWTPWGRAQIINNRIQRYGE